MVWEDELVNRLSRGRLAWPLTVSESYAKASGTLAPPPSIQAPGPDWPARSSVPQQHQQATQQHSCQQVDTIEPRSGPTGRRVKAKPSVGMLARRRVIIIGAGFAGLSAARTIQGSAGDRVEVVVLEASSAVGGRARSAVLPSGAPVELGATWFHGICGNPLYEIAVWEGLVRDWRGDPGLRKHNITWKVDFARPFCKEPLQGHLKEIAEEALERYQQDALELSGDQPAMELSVGAFLRRKFDEAVQSRHLSPEELSVFAESWLFREKQQCSFDGFFATDDVSATFPWEFETLDGPNMPVPGGFQAIAQSLSQSLDIRFEHRVSSIDWGSGGVSVTCTNGAEFEADAVIVTTSIGVLQAQHRTLFQPPLPEWKQAALSAVRLGVADKIFVEWEVDPALAAQQAAATATATAAAAAAAAAGASSMDVTPAKGLEPQPGTSPVAEDRAAVGVGEDRVMTDSDTASGMTGEAGQGDAGAGAGGTSSRVYEYEDPWNVGRRGMVEEQGIEAAAQAAAAVAGISLAAGGGGSGGAGAAAASSGAGAGAGALTVAAPGRLSHPGTGGRSRRPRRKEEILSYALLWPVAQPLSLGSLGTAQALSVLPTTMPYVPPPMVPLFPGMPSWLQGLHSLRFRPGPDWIQPSEEEQFREHQRTQAQGTLPGATGAAGAGAVVGASAGAGAVDAGSALGAGVNPAHPSAVLWITGAAALEMEHLSEAEVTDGILKLFNMFPSIPLPPGAKGQPKISRSQWGTDDLFLGSYSYTRAGVEDGEIVDLIAEPLCADSGMPVVMFAGEATHRHFMGTVHGAYMSGFREAMRYMTALEQQESMLAWSMASASAGADAELHRAGSDGLHTQHLHMTDQAPTFQGPTSLRSQAA